jgi:hypothetical protein
MKIYTEPCTCSVCGGDGVALIGTWTWGELRHVDLAVCAENLRRQREDLERREQAVREIEACTAGKEEGHAQK